MARRDDLLWEAPHLNPDTIGDEARTPINPTPTEALLRDVIRLLADAMGLPREDYAR